MSNLDTEVILSPIILRSFSGDREVDITNLAQNIDIWESVTSAVITASIDIEDGLDLINTFPIIGEEVLEFTFQSKLGEERKVKMIATAIKDKTIDESRKLAFYTIHFASEELIRSSRRLLSKKFSEQASRIVLSIAGEISSKRIIAEETKGIEELTVSNLKPLQAIDWVRQRAISPFYDSSSFCFFENKEGLNFRTLEGLFSDKRDDVGDRIFWFDNNTAVDRRTVTYRNIIAYEHIQTAAPMELVANGAFKNRVTKYDLVTGAIETVDYDDKEFTQADPNANPLSTNAYAQENLETPAVSMFIPWDSSQPTSDTSEKLANLQAFAQKISQNVLRIWIPGDSSLTVGDVIECRFPAASGLSKGSDYERLLAGNYMVAKCRHMITGITNRTYTQSLELIKGSYLG